MFEDVRQALHDLLHGNVAPEDRRDLLNSMRDTLVHARMALDDLRQGTERTRRRLDAERAELETIRRRQTLAEGIGDQETVQVAARFATMHAERLALLTKKLEAEEGEVVLVQREVEEMTLQLKSANAGAGSGIRSGAAPSPDDDGRDPGLAQELDALDRDRRRAASDADAEARLAALKRRMGL
jgi:transposase